VVFLVGFGAWALAAFVCVAFIALICRGGQLEDQLVAVHSEHGQPMPAASAFAPRSALDDLIRTAEQAEV
jgi:hypothetical protein